MPVVSDAIAEQSAAHRMRTLIVGIGALGGALAARLLASGARVWLATRDAESAAILKLGGLHVSGLGDAIEVDRLDVAAVDAYANEGPFDLIVLATKARDAIELGPRLQKSLTPTGVLLPIQNGGVSEILARDLGGSVLAGLSNFGATMTAPGVIAQRNAGHFLLGELDCGVSARAARVRDWLGRAVDVRTTPSIRGAVWSKLLLNCSVTTLGAIAGQTMRAYMTLPEGRELFRRTYDEALSVAIASGARPEPMIVDPIPPAWNGRSVPGDAYEDWLSKIVAGYGDLKASMHQDFERGRTTEIDFINGYIVQVGGLFGVSTPLNASIVVMVDRITRKQIAQRPALFAEILTAVDRAQ